MLFHFFVLYISICCNLSFVVIGDGKERGAKIGFIITDMKPMTRLQNCGLCIDHSFGPRAFQIGRAKECDPLGILLGLEKAKDQVTTLREVRYQVLLITSTSQNEDLTYR